MIRFLFKVNQPKRFQFKPRFYDETKEYIANREAAIRKEMQMDADAGASDLRSRMEKAWSSKSRRQEFKRSNRNILLIAAVLFVLVYLFLK